MGPQSPPKRMTRARAAAKASEPATTKPARIATAAVKARPARSTTAAATATTTTTRTATKRKTRADEGEDEDQDEPAAKMPAIAAKPTRGRGRPKKVAVAEKEPEPEPEPEPEAAPAATVRTRGRPKKVAEPIVERPVKPTRATRTRKTATEQAEKPEPAPVKKTTTRGRPAASATTRTTAAAPTAATKPSTRSLAKPAVKKTVKFEEPEKENVAPTTAATAKPPAKASAPAATTGLRGKPVRKAVSAAGRAGRGTRSAANAAPQAEKEKPMPLSPRKINQLAMNRAESDDELGMDEKPPVPQLKKVPIKLPSGGAKPPSLAKSPAPDSEDEEETAPVGRPATEVSLILGTPAKRLPPSPWKGSIKSPAKRVEGLFSAPAAQPDAQASQTPAKMGLLKSPAKRQPLVLNPFGPDTASGAQAGSSPLKMSLLSSPAKRPTSPIKTLPRMVEEEEEDANQTPAPKPTLLASPLHRDEAGNPEQTTTTEDEDLLIREIDDDDDEMPDSPTRNRFPGRLSAVLPRHADPALTPPKLEQQEGTAQEEADKAPVEGVSQEPDAAETSGEPMVVDNQPTETQVAGPASTTPPSSPPKTENPAFGLREKDLVPCNDLSDSESEDELPARRDRFTSAFSTLPATPRPASAGSAKQVQSSGRSTVKKVGSDEKIGFTPLAHQLSGWTAGPSPLRRNTSTTPPSLDPVVSAPSPNESPSAPPETAQTLETFFEDEMHVRAETMEVEEEPAVASEEENDSTILEDDQLNEEDIALAAETKEMSLVEAEDNDAQSHGHDDSLSDASQEYGDENAVPVDPTLASGISSRGLAAPPVTPQRPAFKREFHTVSKVPLKPADDSTPRPQTERHSRTLSRLPAARSTRGLTRGATVTGYSPTKNANTEPFDGSSEEHDESAPPVTPQKSDIWSAIGTPARTPRRDLNPHLLRGAVVFVDVHTSEGADASGIFIELLTQMGARCVKNWSWNPNTSQSESGAEPKVGITHVVFKDGGKRTLEKVRESAGAVQCVGVSWVLE